MRKASKMISEATLLKSIKQARQEYKMGKTIKAKSVADLIFIKKRKPKSPSSPCRLCSP